MWPLSRLQLRFADCLDKFMLITGLLLTVIAGFAMIGDVIIFGIMVDTFIYHSNAISEVDNISITSLAQSFALSYNVSCDTLLQQEPSVVENITNISSVLCLSKNQRSVMSMACDPSSQLQSEIQCIAYYFITCASVYALAIFIGMLFFNISAYRQTRRVRLAFYISILHQEIGWFDVTDAKQLNNQSLE